MDDTAKLNRAIRLNEIGGVVWLALVGARLALSITGLLPWEPATAVWLVFGAGGAALAFLTARSLRQDRDDPAGVERRFQTQANAFGAAVVVVGLVAVVGLIAWGALG